MMTHLEKHGFITYKKYSYLTGLLKNNIPKDSNRSIHKKNVLLSWCFTFYDKL